MAYLQNGIFERLVDLAACLCVQITEDGLPEPCFCGVVPGAITAYEYRGKCPGKENGMAWTRLITHYPSETVGRISQVTGNCSIPAGFEIEIGIIRAMPIKAKGVAPTQQELLDVTELQIADSMAMRKAVACCLGNPKSWIMGPYTPYGPEGGVVGGGMILYLGS